VFKDDIQNLDEINNNIKEMFINFKELYGRSVHENAEMNINNFGIIKDYLFDFIRELISKK
jgi:hypothetical protein